MLSMLSSAGSGSCSGSGMGSFGESGSGNDSGSKATDSGCWFLVDMMSWLAGETFS